MCARARARRCVRAGGREASLRQKGLRRTCVGKARAVCLRGTWHAHARCAAPSCPTPPTASWPAKAPFVALLPHAVCLAAAGPAVPIRPRPDALLLGRQLLGPVHRWVTRAPPVVTHSTACWRQCKPAGARARCRCPVMRLLPAATLSSNSCKMLERVAAGSRRTSGNTHEGTAGPV